MSIDCVSYCVDMVRARQLLRGRRDRHVVFDQYSGLENWHIMEWEDKYIEKPWYEVHFLDTIRRWKSKNG